MSPVARRLSIVVPVFKGHGFLEDLYDRIRKSVEPLFPDFELVMVNDASPDEAWLDISALCKADERVKGINLSRNFGQHYAITAGLEAASGEWIVVMDCDLQDLPEEIPNLYRRAQEGFDSVFAQRMERQDRPCKRLQSWLYCKIFGYMTDTHLDHSIGNFGIYRHTVIEAILSMKDGIRYFPTMSQWVGFRKSYLPVIHGERHSGQSSYTLRGLLRLAIDNMIAFSDKPLRLFIKAGFLIAILSLGVSLYYYYLHLMGRLQVQGYASIILSIWFIGGMLMFSMGVLGIYISKTFEKVKGRPVFIVAEKINADLGGTS